jgi:lipoyl(octanoyl) transferase
MASNHLCAEPGARADPDRVLCRRLGLAPYQPTWRAMERFTELRDAATPDEIWLLEHPPVFTLGMNGQREHVLSPRDIPVIQTDRGGQVTYHGPGQLVVYALVDLKRAGLGVRDLVSALERAVIGYAGELGIEARARRDAPGVYVDGRKLASVGLRIRRGASYHGIAINVSMDLEPFDRINPCGYAGLKMTQLAELVPGLCLDEVMTGLEPRLLAELGHHRIVTAGGSRPR